MFVLFDVDGTLTPSRGIIDQEFGLWLENWSKNHDINWVTGSDVGKTQEQLGNTLFRCAVYSFNCSGNEIYKHGELVDQNPWQCPSDLLAFLESCLYTSPYPHRAGRHFENRTGMVNFSVVGRNAKQFEREQYFAWDRLNLERELICREINRRWHDCQAVVGGETGIDIFARGCDKSQVMSWLPNDQTVLFFGDRMDPAGNDHSLAQAILTANRGRCYHVTDWKHTWQLLRELDDNNLLPQGRS